MSLLSIPKGIWVEIIYRLKDCYKLIDVGNDFIPLVLRVVENRFDQRSRDWINCARCKSKGVKDAPVAHQRHWIGTIVQKLKPSELIVDLYFDLLDSDFIMRQYTLSDEFLEKHLNAYCNEGKMISWDYIFRHQRPGVEFLKAHRHEITWKHAFDQMASCIPDDLIDLLLDENIITIKFLIGMPMRLRRAFVVKRRLLFMQHFASTGKKRQKHESATQQFLKLLNYRHLYT